MQEPETDKVKILGGDSTMGLFVALYLILLGFFIILNIVSRPSSVKAREAMESVNTTFVSADAVSDDEVAATGQQSAPQSDEFLTNIQGLLFSEFEIQGRFSTYGGNVLSVEIPQEYFFDKGSLRIKTDRRPFLNRLIEMLQSGKKSQYELAFLFGSGQRLFSTEIGRKEEILVLKASALARLLGRLGLNGGSFSTGIVASNSTSITAVFRNKAPITAFEVPRLSTSSAARPLSQGEG